MTGKKIGVGVIGLGFMGRTHVDAFSRVSECEVVAVADRDEVRLLGFPSDGGNLSSDSTERMFDPEITATFKDHSGLLAFDEVDVVSITTPTPTHMEIAVQAIESGRHVLVEKPVALDVASIRRLEALAEEHGVVAMPAHCMRFWPAWSWMHQQIRDETYGTVRRASFVRTGSAPSWNPDFYRDPAKSGGAVVDLHIHDTDFVLHCFGTPDAVSSTGSRSHVRTEYLFENGPVVEAVGGWLEDPEAPFTMTAEIEFEEATISFVLGRDPEILVTRSGGGTTEHPEASVGGTGYDVQAAVLIEAIRYGSGAPPVSLDDAARTGGVLDLEIESLESGGEVRSIRG